MRTECPAEFRATPDLLPNGAIAFEATDHAQWKMADLTDMPVTEVITMTLPAGWSYDDVREFES